MTDTTTEPLLDLSMLAPVRPTIRIKTAGNPDGQLYELRVNDDFGIAEQQALLRDGVEYDRLWNRDKLTSKDRARLKFLLDRMFDLVLDAPAEVKSQLSDSQRSQVVLAFTLAPLAMAAAQPEPEPETQTLTTDS